MPLAKKNSVISEEEYLKGELISYIKHEYINGSIYAMAGSSENHNLITGNISALFKNQLKQKNSPCKTLSESMKVRISKKSTNYFYPDIFVFCDEHKDDTQYYKHSPVIIVEVLSKSTRKNDKTNKKLSYFNIPSLQEYVIIEQDYCEVEVFLKNDNWKSIVYILGESIHFRSIDVTLSVEDIYYQVNNDDITELFS